jgi:hypothetical protein
VAYPYPVDVPFTNTVLAINSAVNDELSIWDNGWTTYTKTSRGGWGAATNLVIEVGQAFFYKSAASSSIDEVKPYTLD